jgi:hypothetical protein
MLDNVMSCEAAKVRWHQSTAVARDLDMLSVTPDDDVRVGIAGSTLPPAVSSPAGLEEGCGSDSNGPGPGLRRA